MTQVQGDRYYRENENDHNDPTGHIECVGRILCRRAANVSYLFAESQCLAEEAHGLLQELETLGRDRFNPLACAMFSHRLRAHHGHLANYTIAVKWTLNPPSEQVEPRPEQLAAARAFC
jgi:hypothetical protein